MSGRLAGKVALVTGGANGIGLACARRFAAEGAAVVIADVLDEPGKAAAAALQDEGARSLFVHLDATSAADADAAVTATVSEFGRLDTLVTAAGISFAGYRSGDEQQLREMSELAGSFDQATALLHLPLEMWQPVLDVNLTGTLLAIQAAGRHMIGQEGGGSIVAIASIAALTPEVGAAAYSVSKAGVWMLCKEASYALSPHGVRVNAVGPGFIDTNMTKIISGESDRAPAMVGQIPMKRFGRPEEIAGVVLFLASDDASYVTGELYLADGGLFTH